MYMYICICMYVNVRLSDHHARTRQASATYAEGRTLEKDEWSFPQRKTTTRESEGSRERERDRESTRE